MEMPTVLSWRSNRVWARSDTNTYAEPRDLRFMVGYKVQANVDGEFVNGIVTRQREDDSQYRIQLEDGDRSNCWAPKILMLMLGLLVNKFY